MYPDEENEGFLGDSQSSSAKEKEVNEMPMCGCLSVAFYKPYFNVDTKDVWDRLLMAAFYCRKDNSFMTLIDSNPDAYGPFWISTSLIFSIAVTSHISSWLAAYYLGTDWSYDFEKVVSSATLIYCFAGFVPLGMYFTFRQFGAIYSLISLVCLYGYSLLSFIPATALCIVPYAFTEWIAFLVAFGISSLFLIRNLAPTMVQNAKQSAVTMLGLTVAVQFALMLCIKIGFYSVSWNQMAS